MITKKTAADWVGQEFTIIREYAAPREWVFRACTDPAHLAQWWGPKGFTAPVCEWDSRPGGKIYVIMRAPDGTEYPMGGTVREVDPPARMVSTTGALDARGNFLFEFLHTLTLRERNGKTELTMHSRIISATPEAGQYLGGFETGMTMSLERLGEYLTQPNDSQVTNQNQPNQPLPAMTTTPHKTTIQPYLFFNGRCEEAIEFYRQALQAEVKLLMRFKDSPDPAMCPPGSAEKIMHATLGIGQTLIMASDGRCEEAPAFQGFALSLTLTDVADADRYFAALAAGGGQVQMPLAKTFYSPRFGMVTDRFGVLWMVYVTQ